MALLYDMFRVLFAEGQFRFIDYGIGESRWKRTYSTSSQFCADLYFFRRTGRNAALVALHYAAEQISSAAGRLLEQHGWKERLRRSLRSQVRTTAEPV